MEIDLQKVFEALPDGAKVILPEGEFEITGDVEMRPRQVLEGTGTGTYLTGDSNILRPKVVIM